MKAERKIAIPPIHPTLRGTGAGGQVTEHNLESKDGNTFAAPLRLGSAGGTFAAAVRLPPGLAHDRFTHCTLLTLGHRPMACWQAGSKAPMPQMERGVLH